ncbi:MAG: hypothetical protein VX589_20425, partial [Myxococcota bacterium]|nr:hypothetical protein [Myxococcota bacterium]
MRKNWPGLLIVCLLFAASAAVAGDGRLRWQTIETAHFRVHYPVPLDSVAARTAILCEEAYSILTPLFEHTPTTQIDVAVTDFSDQSNGSASAIPVPRMTVLAAPPRLDSNLGDQTDWLRLLIFHEFTHILQLDQVSGIPKWVNHIFGRLIASNHNLPSFQLEGGAVWAESITSGYGRIHSASFRGFLRAQALAGRLFDLDEVIHTPLDFPGANVWYMYGGHFTHWAVQRLGYGWLAALHRDIGRQFLAFGINRSTLRSTGESISALYTQWQNALTAQSNREALAIKMQGETPVDLITRNGRSHTNLRFLPDGTLLSLEGVDREFGIYARAQAGAGPIKALFVEENITEFDICNGGESLVYTRAMKIRGAYRYNDLYLYHRQSGAIRRITTGARLREIHCAVDGTTVFAAQIFQGQTRLVHIDLTTGSLKVLHSPEQTGQVAFPLHIPTLSKIVFMQVGPTFGRDLVALNLRTGGLERLTNDAALELRPRPGQTPGEIIYASDRDGVFNAYALNLKTGDGRRLTRVVNGVTATEINPSGNALAVITITANGYDIGSVIPRVFEETTSSHRSMPLGRTMPHDGMQSQLIRREYAPTERLWPLRWSPAFSFSTATDTASQIGLELDVTDPLNHHAISGSLVANPDENELDATMRYSFRRFIVNYGASVSRRTAVNPSGAFYEGEQQPERRRVGAATFSVGLPLS